MALTDMTILRTVMSPRPVTSPLKQRWLRAQVVLRALRPSPRQLRGVVGISIAWAAMLASFAVPGSLSFLLQRGQPLITLSVRLDVVANMLLPLAKFGFVYGLTFSCLMLLAARWVPSLRKLPLLGVSAIGGIAVLLPTTLTSWADLGLTGTRQILMLGAAMAAVSVGLARRGRARQAEATEPE